MRRIAFALLAVLATSSVAAAQEQTLAGDGLESGGFGAPVVKFSDVGGEFAVFAGARGGWIIDHTFVLGLGGYGLASNIGDDPFEREVEFGYGGLELEYIKNSDKLVHFTIYALVGGGAVVYLDDVVDGVFVLEPAVNLIVNVTQWFRLGVGGGYRFVEGANSDLSNKELSAPVGVLTFKFGSF
ncbi:MAG: hypothetical protein AMS21_13295 [Gemmatimonas sp. SG8_38_2]|nr:MAG: hypothetical protein AMS21_13295 [Gemmatimonas sp. SG8_38_2]